MEYDSTKVDTQSITPDCEQNVLPGIDIRYSLTIPLKNEQAEQSVVIVLMNPSKANRYISDPTVNKLIDFFSMYIVNGKRIKEITICNILPIYASNTDGALEKIKQLSVAGYLDGILDKNECKIIEILKGSSCIVCAWGKPKVKTISNLFYYREVNRLIQVMQTINRKLFVLDIANTSSKLTEHGDPRHAARSVNLDGLLPTTIDELLGLI